MSDGGYAFHADPHAVGARKKANIMFDSRVRRGNTYAGRVEPVNEAGAGGGTASSAGVHHRMKGPRVRQNIFDAPVAPRVHEAIDLTPFLVAPEEPHSEAEVMVQTDSFQPRPVSAGYRPPKTGVDAATQIEADELFDFDVEVEPIVAVVAAKILEQALMEVEEESELWELEDRKQQLLAANAAEAERVREMQRAEARQQKEKSELLAGRRARAAEEARLLGVLAARQSASALLAEARTRAYTNLRESGHFVDPLRATAEAALAPMVEAAERALADRELAQRVLDELIRGALALQRKQEAAARAARAPQSIRVFVKGVRPDGAVTTVGPISVGQEDTITDIEGRIHKWLVTNVSRDIVVPPGGFLRMSFGSVPLRGDMTLAEATALGSGGGAVEFEKR